MRRTKEERETLITEKVAIILMGEDGRPVCTALNISHNTHSVDGCLDPTENLRKYQNEASAETLKVLLVSLSCIATHFILVDNDISCVSFQPKSVSRVTGCKTVGCYTATKFLAEPPPVPFFLVLSWRWSRSSFIMLVPICSATWHIADDKSPCAHCFAKLKFHVCVEWFFLMSADRLTLDWYEQCI